MSDEYPSGISLLILAFAGDLVAIDRATGQRKWECPLPEAEGAIDFAIHSGRVYAAAFPGKLYCLDYLTGQGLWQVDVFERASSSAWRPALLVVGDQIFVMDWHGAVACFDLDGKRQWNAETHRPGLLSSPGMGVPGNLRKADTIGKK